MSEIDMHLIYAIADELTTALESEGQYLMGLTDDRERDEIIDKMVQAGVCAVMQIADSQIVKL